MIDVASEVLAAEERIRPHVRETPVEFSPSLSAPGGARVWLKLENLQATGSFKLRGATSKLLSLPAAARRRGVVAASSGNHGLGVAHALRAAGGRGVIFVPEGASPTKVEAIRAYGRSGAPVEVFAVAGDPVLAERAARRHAEEHGRVYVSPYNDPAVLGGQGTIGVELARQLPRIDALFVALGGGGLISGVAGYLKSLGGALEVVACSPASSPVMHESVRAGRILDLDSAPTLSDGTAGGVEEGAITFELCRRLVDRYVLVSEEEIAAAMRWVIGRHHTLIEGAAGVAVAGYLKRPERYRGRDVAIILCGANVDLANLRRVLGGGEGSGSPGG